MAPLHLTHKAIIWPFDLANPTYVSLLSELHAPFYSPELLAVAWMVTLSNCTLFSQHVPPFLSSWLTSQASLQNVAASRKPCLPPPQGAGDVAPFLLPKWFCSFWELRWLGYLLSRQPLCEDGVCLLNGAWCDTPSPGRVPVPGRKHSGVA